MLSTFQLTRVLFSLFLFSYKAANEGCPDDSDRAANLTRTQKHQSDSQPKRLTPLIQIIPRSPEDRGGIPPIPLPVQPKSHVLNVENAGYDGTVRSRALHVRLRRLLGHAPCPTAPVPHPTATKTAGPGRIHGGAAGLQRGAIGPTAMGERCLPGNAGKWENLPKI